MKRKRLFALLLLISMLTLVSACGMVSTEKAATYSDDIEVSVPEGKPQPVDEESQSVDKSKTGTCTLLVECSTILDNMESLKREKYDLVPADGVIFEKQDVTFYEGETVFDVLKREMIDHKIHLEFEWSPVYSSTYVSGIGNLYEFDCGSTSGWNYFVNDWSPNYGCSRYLVSEGDAISWRYTCDMGKDLGIDVE